MNIMIHACPERMWYVEDFLVPSLMAQGIQETQIRVWNDEGRRGNLRACMEAFASCGGDGGTWHLQDDVLICRDFALRAAAHDRGLVYGFCCRQFGDDPSLTGTVYPPDMWHSFQCVRIPDPVARECAEWYFSGKWKTAQEPELYLLEKTNRGDDTMFHTFFETVHGRETACNLGPCLAEHVDFLLGGSVVSRWRGFPARAALWEDEELVEEMKKRIRERA